MARSKASRDKIIAYDLLKRLLTDPRDTEAFQLGLIDGQGNILREAETKEEKEALTTLDMLVLKIKDLLGGRISTLRKYMYVKNFDNSIIEDIILLNETRAEKREYLQRIERDIRDSLR